MTFFDSDVNRVKSAPAWIANYVHREGQNSIDLQDEILKCVSTKYDNFIKIIHLGLLLRRRKVL